MKPDYIFIVGCFRSGTDLMVGILNDSGQVCIPPWETQYVGHLIRPAFRQRMRECGDLSQDSNVHKLVEYIYTGKGTVYREYWEWLRTHIDRERFLQRVLDSDRSDRAIFVIAMEVYARECGSEEAILGEKTPFHVYHVPILLEWFPNARIIHMLRDPRAVYVSWEGFENRRGIKRFKHFPFSMFNSLYRMLHVTAAWFRAANLHFQYKRSYPANYYLLKFEDLIRDPEMRIKRICDFIDIEFKSEMLAQSVINSSFTAGYIGAAGFDRKMIDRWKERISPWAKWWFTVVGRKYLKEFGYTD